MLQSSERVNLFLGWLKKEIIPPCRLYTQGGRRDNLTSDREEAPKENESKESNDHD